MRYATITEVSGKFIVGAAEYCGGCGKPADAGKLAAVATDHRDMRNGHTLVCPECLAAWRVVRDAVAEEEATSALIRDFFHAHVTGLVTELDDDASPMALLPAVQAALTDL